MPMQKTSQPPFDPATGKPLQPRDQPGYYSGFTTLSQQAYWDAKTREVVLARMQPSPALRFFSPEEAATMLAVTARLLPQEDRTPERRIPVLPGIDQRLADNKIDGYRYEDMPSDQEAYRLAAHAFEAMAITLHQRSFHELETRDQEEILKSLHDNAPQAATELWGKMSLARFWALLIGDCCSVYYAHPWAWDEIGFGGPAYPRGYMRLEEGEAEPWEVDEQRYDWAPPADTLSGEENSSGSGQQHQTTPGQGGTH